MSSQGDGSSGRARAFPMEDPVQVPALHHPSSTAECSLTPLVVYPPKKGTASLCGYGVGTKALCALLAQSSEFSSLWACLIKDLKVIE